MTCSVVLCKHHSEFVSIFHASRRICAARGGSFEAAAAVSPSRCGGDELLNPFWPARHWTKSCQKMTPRNAGKPGEWNHSRAVEYETPAHTANSLAFKA